MSKYLFIFSASFIVITLNSVTAQGTSQLTEEQFMKQLRKAEDEFHNYLPKIELLENEYANDTEYLIGSALLYSGYGNYEGIQEKIDKQWDRVLSIDPNNKVALATTVKDIQFYPERLSQKFDELESMINAAKKRGSGSITIEYKINYGPSVIVEKYGEKLLQPTQTSQSQLYKYFSKGDNKDIVINDFESAKVQLKAKLNVELAKSLDLIDNAENRDPNNALYNYTKAHIYFKLGYNDYGLNQIKIGAQKKYSYAYYPQISQYVSKVLELIDFPKPLRQYITVSYSPTAQFIRESILNENLEPLIDEYLKQDKNDKIKEIIDMVSLIKVQILQEPMPDKTLNQRYGEILEKWIIKYKSKLSN